MFSFAKLAVFLCLGIEVLANSDNLVLRQSSVLFNHGLRTPTAFPFKTDPYTESDWPQGYMQLTITGMQQMHRLGELLRNRYTSENSLVNENYTRVQVYVRSTDYDVALMSAEAQLAGLFPPGPSQRFDESLNWQPIPVHTVPKSEEYLLRATLSCPRFMELIVENRGFAFLLNEQEKYQGFLSRLEEITGVIPLNFSNVWLLADTIIIQSLSQGYEPPSWANESVISTLTTIDNFIYSALFNYEKAELKQRLSAGPFLGKVSADMKSKAESNQNDSTNALFLYSAHESTIISITSALKVYNGKRPGFASALVIELYSDPNNNYFVKVLYRGGPDNDTFEELNVPCKMGGASLCTLEEFSNFVMPLIPDDIEMECAIPSVTITTDNSSGHIYVSLGGLIGLLAAITVVLIIF